MHRRVRVTGLLIASFLVALAACVSGCGGAGDTYCAPDDTTCDYTTPVDTPTDSPTDTPEPPDCVAAADVDVLFPVDASSFSSYANTVYLSFTSGADFTWSYAVDFVVTRPGQGAAGSIEYGSTIRDVTESAPSYVPPPPPPYAGIFASSNLPLPADSTVYLTLVDTRQPARCPALSLAQIDTTTHAVHRLPATRGMRASASRAAWPSLLPPRAGRP